MISQEETDKRQTPEFGETWEFSNGVIAMIAEAGDAPRPEIAFTDAHLYLTEGKTGFKFNATNDPMPVRRI